MSLEELQRSIAALVSDHRSLDAYLHDPHGWIASRRLNSREAQVLMGLDGEHVASFHEIYARDRAFFVEAVLPRSTRRLGVSWSRGYFDAHPQADADTRVEAALFVAWLDTTSADLATRTLARFELASFLLLDAPPFEAAEGSTHREPGELRPAPGIAIVPSSLHLPTLIDGEGDAAPVEVGVALLRRTPEGVESAWLEGPAAHFLAAVETRDVDALHAIMARRDGQQAALSIFDEGVLR